MTDFVVTDLQFNDINRINIMCTAPGKESESVLRESAEIHAQVARFGVKTFAVFDKEHPIARLEVMPIDVAPFALHGEDLWFVRCVWVLPEYQNKGIAAELMNAALSVAAGSSGIATVTYENWTPVEFFQRYGFEVVDQRDSSILMLLKFESSASVRFVKYKFQSRAFQNKITVRLVMTGRCPWIMQSWRSWAAQVKQLYSGKVEIQESFILHRCDAITQGEEGIYVDDIPYTGLQQLSAFVGFCKTQIENKRKHKEM
ncbi:MAG TPA: GNAT family N-acetyltransferase [Pseudothermotoga sp.]|nr:GNAT family N-acetyltransferase [Pseudothermotoga sp.]HOK82929.1 GNAT family N-acetyltransferase [Pseudothermotoga sp.]HPP69897.1 GNAT family N-acetyltransferase [Pseudothermotoga sp.]